MGGFLDLAAQNLLTPMILCFVLGVAAALARSDLSVPEAAAKAMSLYLLFSIGFKGGVAVAKHGFSSDLISSLAVGVFLSFLLPFIAYALLRAITKLSALDAAAVSAHYGSISIVTFVTATSVLTGRGIESEGYMVAVAAAMEAPAIVSALWLVARSGSGPRMDAKLWHEILLNGSIVLLIGSFVIGIATIGTPRASDSSAVLSPAWVMASVARSRSSSCGATGTTTGLPGHRATIDATS